MTELVGHVTLFKENQDPSSFENVGRVRLYRENVGEIKLFKPFGVYIPPDSSGSENPDFRLKHDKITINETHIAEKRFFLSKTAHNPSTTIFLPEGGIPQFIDEDFALIDKTLSWEGLGLDGFIEVNDVIHVYYT